jgi:chaperone required for assembly of F1-ATPase
VTASLLPAPQPKATIDGVRRIIEAVDDWQLVGLHGATTGLGSVVLALALWHGRIDAAAAADASLLDALFELEKWGQERDANRRHDALRRDIRGIAIYLQHMPPDESAGAGGA